ncbi:hypothetical protein D8W71_04005 [Rhodococcus sp. P1Y]|nr:hypothetical protein D8W71_04005 [Rhodococcus sp. P1Y]
MVPICLEIAKANAPASIAAFTPSACQLLDVREMSSPLSGCALSQMSSWDITSNGSSVTDLLSSSSVYPSCSCNSRSFVPPISRPLGVPPSTIP